MFNNKITVNYILHLNNSTYLHFRSLDGLTGVAYLLNVSNFQKCGDFRAVSVLA